MYLFIGFATCAILSLIIALAATKAASIAEASMYSWQRNHLKNETISQTGANQTFCIIYTDPIPKR